MLPPIATYQALRRFLAADHDPVTRHDPASVLVGAALAILHLALEEPTVVETLHDRLLDALVELATPADPDRADRFRAALEELVHRNAVALHLVLTGDLVVPDSRLGPAALPPSIN